MKREYAQANKDWLAAKAQEEGVEPSPREFIIRCCQKKKLNHEDKDIDYGGQRFLGKPTGLLLQGEVRFVVAIAQRIEHQS